MRFFGILAFSFIMLGAMQALATKPTAGLLLSLEAGTKTPAAGEEVALTLRLVSERNLSKVKLELRLPEDVELLSGEHVQVLEDLQQGQTISRQWTIRSRDVSQKIIHAVAITAEGPNFRESAVTEVILNKSPAAGREPSAGISAEGKKLIVYPSR